MYPPEDIQLRPNTVDTPATREDISGYYAHITALDENLGRLMAALDELGIAEDTILVYTSDHGDMLGSHGHVRKERPWDESARIPFMIRWPRSIPAGVTRDTLLSLVDFMPSMLSLCDLPIPEGVEGIDLSDAMLGETIDEPESVCLGVPLHGSEGFNFGIREWRGVRTHRYTYARHHDGTGWLLYDNDNDPYQLNNLIDDADAQDLRAELEAETPAMAHSHQRSVPTRIRTYPTTRFIGVVEHQRTTVRRQKPTLGIRGFLLMKKRVLIIGWDCAAPELVFEAFKDDMPNTHRLMAEGTYGKLESTIPPITVPAWMCMMTSRDPGELGVYGFRNRKDYSYDAMTIANSHAVKVPTPLGSIRKS